MINTSTFATVSLEGHTAPVLSVDLDKSGNTVVSSSCDGSVRIWSVETKKQVGASSEVKLSEQTSLHAKFGSSHFGQDFGDLGLGT